MIFNFNAAEVFQIAIQIEENGRKFYEDSQEVIDDEEVRKLFEQLALEEIEHKKKFEHLKSQLPPEASVQAVFDPENAQDEYIEMMASQHVFVSGEEMDVRLSSVKNVKEALQLAIDFEKDSVIFFLTIQDATDGKKGKEFIGLLVKEEQEHLRRLATQLKRISRRNG